MIAVNDIVTVSEAAHFLRKHPGTIRKWIVTRKLPATRLIAGGHGIYAILRTDLIEVALVEAIENPTKPSAAHVPIDANQRKLPF